jgi:hypothetical protein
VRAQLAGKSAVDCAIADINTRFDRAGRINRHKMRVESALRRGSSSLDVRCFYSMVTRLLQRRRVRTLDEALTILWAEKTRTATIESYLGVPRLIIRRETIDEAILALRWLRAHRRSIGMPALIEAMKEGPGHRPSIHLMAAANAGYFNEAG